MGSSKKQKLFGVSAPARHRMHLSALAGGVLGGNVDGQALLCEYIKILLVNLAPNGCWAPHVHGRLA